ncbi:MAG: hypothetical protein K8I29_12095 [Alphaproteobacteria bacterium]|uniref:Type II/III secretion system secretin-like domain-containing protein n=1 Tax=Candidatus Nitrobium versatile TaxID=2884831 RepID=A0A953JD72_9BACT|nr:hypothetical protein [Candidatus Nitrobium versatile]
MKKAHIVFLLLTVASLAGCGKPAFYKAEELSREADLKAESRELINEESVPVRELRIRSPFVEDRLNLDALTDIVSIDYKEPILLNDFFLDVFKQTGISAVFNLTTEETAQGGTVQQSSGANKGKDIILNVPHYKGTVRDLLHSLMETHGIFFRHAHNTLTAVLKDTFALHIDNYMDVGKVLESTLKSLGAEKISYDPISSKVYFSADYKTYRKVREMAQNMKDNMSIITLHMIVGELELTDSYSRGIDWNNLSLAYLSPASALRSAASSTTSTSTDGSSSDSSSTSSTGGVSLGGATVGNKSGYVQFSNGVAGINISASNFGLSSFLNLLDQYGKFKTIQNTYVAMNNGYRGKIDASQKTPYVSQVGLGVIGSGTATSNTQTVQFEEVSAGTVIDIVPYYNARTDLLSFSIDGKVQSIVSYVTLSTGQVTVSRPVVSARNINTQIAMRPDSVVVLGGLMNREESYSTQGLPELSATVLGNHKKSNKKSELIIIIRPYITKVVVEG